MSIKSVFGAINKFDDQYMRPVRSVMFAGTLAASGWAAMQANQNATAFEEFKEEFAELRDQLVGAAAGAAADVNARLAECDGDLACQARALRSNDAGQSDGSGASGDFSDVAEPAVQSTPEIEEEKPSLRDRAADGIGNFLNRDPN